MKSEKLWVACETCEKQISVKAKACPHCGGRRKRSGKWKWIGGGVIAMTILAVISAPDKPRSTGIDGPTKSLTVSARASDEVTLPAAQTAFIAMIADYKSRFSSAKNEFQESALRDQRRASILQSLGSQMEIRDWIGTLRQLETSTDGKGIITVRMTPDLSVQTWNNALTDSLYGTMIEKSTPSYSALMQMKTGDKVRFSGSFIPAESDGVLEGSITIRGAMTAPEFLFRFSDIREY